MDNGAMVDKDWCQCERTTIECMVRSPGRTEHRERKLSNIRLANMLQACVPAGCAIIRLSKMAASKSKQPVMCLCWEAPGHRCACFAIERVVCSCVWLGKCLPHTHTFLKMLPVQAALPYALICNLHSKAIKTFFLQVHVW